MTFLKNIDFIFEYMPTIITIILFIKYMSTKKTIVKKPKKKAVPKALRTKVWELTIGNKLIGNCYACDREIKFDSFEAGHVIAEANGGETNVNNLRVVC